jgi:hypothetical protein
LLAAACLAAQSYSSIPPPAALQLLAAAAARVSAWLNLLHLRRQRQHLVLVSSHRICPAPDPSPVAAPAPAPPTLPPVPAPTSSASGLVRSGAAAGDTGVDHRTAMGVLAVAAITRSSIGAERTALVLVFYYHHQRPAAAGMADRAQARNVTVSRDQRGCSDWPRGPGGLFTANHAPAM